jgi:hypothetical protein
MALVAFGCGENHELTDGPISMDIYVDSTYSNDQVAINCMTDVMDAATLAAGSRGFLKFHTFDGDPFRRRGLSESFESERIPSNIEGTSGETAYLEGLAEDLQGEIERLIAEPPAVGGSPLVELLQRAGRHTPSSSALPRILICTDGLFTDVNPLEMAPADARAAGESLPASLNGVTVEFIGLDGSAPGRGRRIEQTKPLVQALLRGAGAELGNWELELSPDWRQEMIVAVDGGAGQ